MWSIASNTADAAASLSLLRSRLADGIISIRHRFEVTLSDD